jgi:hypothetical protein
MKLSQAKAKVIPSVRILLLLKPKMLAFSVSLYQVKLLSVHLSPKMTGQPPSCSSMSRASLLLLFSMYASSMQLLYKFLLEGRFQAFTSRRGKEGCGVAK